MKRFLSNLIICSTVMTFCNNLFVADASNILASTSPVLAPFNYTVFSNSVDIINSNEVTDINEETTSDVADENQEDLQEVLPQFFFGSTILNETNLVSINGELPNIKPLANMTVSTSNLIDEVTKEIKNIYNEKVEMAKNAKASSIDFSYVIKISNNQYYVLINSVTNSTRSIESTDVISFSTNTNRLLYINDVLGSNGVTVINDYLNQMISKDPKSYISNFQGITNEQDFYIDDDSFYLVFDGYEILIGSPEVHLVSLPVDRIRNFYVDHLDTYSTGSYNILMVPIRQIADVYGYSIEWIENSSTIILSKGDWYVSMTLDKNSYQLSNKNSPITLESAPELLVDGTTFLPISFFSDVLNLSYTIDINGNIIFTSIVLDDISE